MPNGHPEALAQRPRRASALPAKAFAAPLILFTASMFSNIATSAEVSLEWDGVDDARVAFYELHWGTASGIYEHLEQISGTTATFQDLAEGSTYYFAVRACAQAAALCSAFSREISSTIAYRPPTADFVVTKQNGALPLTVTFSDASSGAIDTYAWDFGDGGTSTERAPTHTYAIAGAYTVTLTVTGPGGASKAAKPETIVVAHTPPVANFTASATAGAAPLSVVFQDISEGKIDTYLWDLGDGGQSSAPTSVHTYNEPGSYTVTLTVTGPGGNVTETKSDLITVSPLAPVAAFDAVATTGEAPLAVQFSDQSTSAITSYLWSFGDGSSSAESNPSHVYGEPGAYDVSLTVVGPGGTDTLTQPGLIEVLPPELTMEIGELSIDEQAERVDFRQRFNDPIVIVGPASGDGGDPVTVRLGSVDKDGFWVRLQEWDYLDGPHIPESVGYLVLERGIHRLPNGSWIEADELEVDGHGIAEGGLFAAPFATKPVVLASVRTLNDHRPVTTRLKEIDTAGFQIALQSEEASVVAHGTETVAYLAWEPSCGEVNGLRFNAATTGDDRTDTPVSVRFSGQCSDETTRFNTPPVVLAAMQTTDGPDTANLRWLYKLLDSVTFWIDEEQSRDTETEHTTEAIGYLAVGNTDGVNLGTRQ